MNDYDKACKATIMSLEQIDAYACLAREIAHNQLRYIGRQLKKTGACAVILNQDEVNFIPGFENE